MVAVVLGAPLLVVVGCNKRQADAPANANDASAAPATEAGSPALAPSGAFPAAPFGDSGSNATLVSAEFLAQSTASPFAESNAALRQSYDRALAAFQIGDYARAYRELHDLAANSKLTESQRQAVEGLSLQTLRLAPGLAASTQAGTSAPGPKTNTPVQSP